MTSIVAMILLSIIIILPIAVVGQKTADTLPRRKILVTNLGLSSSHNLIMSRLADKLGARGNDVTLLQYEIMTQAKKPTLHHAKRIMYNVVENASLVAAFQRHMSSFTWKPETMSISGARESVPMMFELFSGGCERLIEKNQSLINEMKAKKYDAIILHVIDVCTLSLTKHLGVKAYALFSPAFQVDMIARYLGSSYPASYVPSSGIHATDRMSFTERMKNLVYGTLGNAFFDVTMLRIYNRLTRKHFGADYPSMQQLLTETQLFFVNTDAFFEYPRPGQANIIQVGSVGKCVQTISHYTFITRIDGDMTTAKDVPNIHLTSWIPQKDLLAHEKVKAFITRGGYNSLTEATYLGVPMVMFPLFGDQGQNAKRVERLELGITLDKNLATEEDVYNALDEILNNPEQDKLRGYARKASHVSRLMRGKPFSSEETAMRWIEFLADYKDLDVLKPESRHMSFVAYYNLDVLALLHLIGALVLYGMYAVLRCCYRRCFSKKAATSSTKKRQ